MALAESTTRTLEIALDTINIEKQAIIFANTRRSAEKSAEELAKKIEKKSEGRGLIKNLKNDDFLKEIETEILNVLSSPTKQCKRLAFCVKMGVAFHHSGLAPKQREIVEDSFREGKIRVICSTPTLAYGLDLPAFRVILQNLKRYSNRGLRYIPVLEYLQMSGRAGRPKFDNLGESIAIATTEKQKQELIDIYLNGEPEDIYSKLATEPALRANILSLIATEFVQNKEELLSFFSKTFWAHHYGDMYQLNVIITRILNMLEMWDFINVEGDIDFDEDVSINASLLGKRVSQLYLDPLTANSVIVGLKKANKDTKTFAFLQLISHTLELRPLLRVKKTEEELIEMVITKYEGNLLQEFVDYEYSEDKQSYLNSLKTALFFFNWINEFSEEKLLEKFDIRPGEISVKLQISKWLIYSSVELAKIVGLKEIINPLMKLDARLKYGAKEELLPLLKLKGIGRIRARKMFNNNIKDMGSLKCAKFDILAQLIGNNIAISIKKQVGQDFSKMKIKKNKRKGQLSLKKYEKS